MPDSSFTHRKQGGGELPWWRHGLVYQVYIRSFADANGDGTGDVNGLRSRLPYLRELGIDAIWINPWYQSPLADGGYDVADYRQIEPRFGNLAQAEALIAEAHDHDIKVITDVVPNHTSDQHAWFREAVTAAPGHPSRNRYHILPGMGANGEKPPTDWPSVFGGPAWARLPDGEWYLHLFAPEQPDLNWANPDVNEGFQDMLRFWLDRGVDGFRVDVAHGLVKHPDYPDVNHDSGDVLATAKDRNHPFWDRDGIHDIVRTWRTVLEEYPGDRMMVAEAWVDPERLPLYLRPDEYHQSFSFALVESDWDAEDFAAIIEKSTRAAAEVGSTPTWVLSNHDVMREATRYGLPKGTKLRTWPLTGPFDVLDVDAGARRARAAALVMLGLPGSAYLYQGEELGLPEVWDLPPEVLDDPVWENSHHAQKGRDGCRVPIPWTVDGPSFGFGPGEPWLPQPEDWGSLSVAAQDDDPDSTLSLYRDAIAARRRYCMDDDSLEMLDVGGPDDHVVAFRRGSGLSCVVNFGPGVVRLPDHTEVVVRSDHHGHDSADLAPDTAAWLL